MEFYRIVLADDNLFFRRTLKKIINGTQHLEVVGEAGDGLEAVNLLNLSKLAPHMVILDISMPNLNGIEATRQIKRLDPAIKVLILTIHKDNEYLTQAFSAGADGYLAKDDASTELFSAIEKIREGIVYVSPILREQGSLADGPGERR